ncbi:MAG TPA: hypothetical protein VMM83_08575 [Longimicrobiales bacterium]|nr:hypothetical protein [Longimicrobiales bacterium]
MRRGVLILAAAVAAATMSACGGGDVAVVVALDGESAGAQDAGTVALGNLPVRLLPYDRDAIFDSLIEAYPEPEPQLPDTVAALQERVQLRYGEWQEAERRWGMLRDSLQSLVRRMEGMDQSSGDYFVAFQAFGEMEGEVEELETRSSDAFEEFTTLQSRLSQESREVELARLAWEEEAFAPVDSIILARYEETGLEEMADTTDAQGLARFNGVSPGQWWLHARYERQFDELYWNEPIEVTRGEELVVRLSGENAEVR